MMEAPVGALGAVDPGGACLVPASSPSFSPGGLWKHAVVSGGLTLPLDDWLRTYDESADEARDRRPVSLAGTPRRWDAATASSKADPFDELGEPTEPAVVVVPCATSRTADARPPSSSSSSSKREAPTDAAMTYDQHVNQNAAERRALARRASASTPSPIDAWLAARSLEAYGPALRAIGMKRISDLAYLTPEDMLDLGIPIDQHAHFNIVVG
mmetsp:Transcript_20772/g.82857  ORF Transcript_20772/g.82857 Transcript_20772/m.82857 type:complete len:213 (+) Transcript_20772:68-706(+)